MDRIFKAFTERGKQLFLVGGAVRDFLRGVPIDGQPDLDFATDATPEEVIEVLASARLKFFDIGKPFGTIGTVLYGKGPGYPKDVQITTYRSKEVYRRGDRHPQVTFGKTIEEDLSRRDFSVNSIAMDPKGTLIDPYGGQEDIRRKRLRVIGPPDEILRDDPLRMLRAARFISQLGFEPDAELRSVVTELAVEILSISRERWFQEMDRLLAGGHADEALQFLHETRLLGIILPELETLVGFDQTSQHHHKDVWEHTKKVVKNAPARQAVRWAALLHDIGKVWTRIETPDGEVHFYRHEEVGAMLFEGISLRFRFDKALRKQVSFLIRNHLRIPLYDGTWTDSAVARLMRDVGEHLSDLVDLGKADITSSRIMKVRMGTARIDELWSRCVAITERERNKPVIPKGLGARIMETFGLPEGREVGRLRRIVVEAVAAGEIEGGLEAERYVEFLRNKQKIDKSMT